MSFTVYIIKGNFEKKMKIIPKSLNDIRLGKCFWEESTSLLLIIDLSNKMWGQHYGSAG